MDFAKRVGGNKRGGWKTRMDFAKRGGWNKRGGWKIIMKSINVQGGFLFCVGWNFPKSVSVTSRLLER